MCSFATGLLLLCESPRADLARAEKENVSVLSRARARPIRRVLRGISQLSSAIARWFSAKYFLLLWSNCAMLLKIFCMLIEIAAKDSSSTRRKFRSRSVRRVMNGFAAGYSGGRIVRSDERALCLLL
jgi:hypothetical protein